MSTFFLYVNFISSSYLFLNSMVYQVIKSLQLLYTEKTVEGKIILLYCVEQYNILKTKYTQKVCYV